MLADGRLGKVHVLDKVANPVLTGREVLEEGQARRFGKGMEERGVAVCDLELGLGQESINRHTAMISLFGLM
ncbi:hypothetical protein GCM10009625_00650 [Brachybacterium fresconis]